MTEITIGGMIFEIKAVPLARLKKIQEIVNRAIQHLDIEKELGVDALITHLFDQAVGTVNQLWPLITGGLKPEDNWLADNVTIPELKALLEIFLKENGLELDKIVPFVRKMVGQVKLRQAD